MNFLQLVQRVRQECGVSGSGPSTVVSQTGELKRLVEWTQEAYIALQNSNTWNWLWDDTTPALTSGGRVYNPVTDWSIFPIQWDTDSLTCYLTSVGVADEQRLHYLTWPEFKATNGYGYGYVQTNRPVAFSIRPDRSIIFDSYLDQDYTIRGEYWGTPETLSLDADLPALPEQYHMAIVWRAVMAYAQYEEAGVLLQLAEKEFNRYYGSMTRTELPEVVAGGAMA